MRCPGEEFKLNLSNMSSFFGELLSTCFIRSAPGVWVPPVDGDLLEIGDPGRRRPLSHGGLGEAGAVLGAEEVRKPNKIRQGVFLRKYIMVITERHIADFLYNSFFLTINLFCGEYGTHQKTVLLFFPHDNTFTEIQRRFILS